MQEAETKAGREPTRPGRGNFSRWSAVGCLWYALLWCSLPVDSRASFVHSDDHAGGAGFGMEDTEQVCEDAIDARGPDCGGSNSDDGEAIGGDDEDIRQRLGAPARVPALHARQSIRQRYLVGGGVRAAIATAQREARTAALARLQP